MFDLATPKREGSTAAYSGDPAEPDNEPKTIYMEIRIDPRNPEAVIAQVREWLADKENWDWAYPEEK